MRSADFRARVSYRSNLVAKYEAKAAELSHDNFLTDGSLGRVLIHEPGLLDDKRGSRRQVDRKSSLMTAGLFGRRAEGALTDSVF